MRVLKPDKNECGAEGAGGYLRGMCECILCVTMHLYPSWGSCLCSLSVSSESKLPIRKHKICVVLKLFSIVSIVLEICVCETSVISMD